MHGWLDLCPVLEITHSLFSRLNKLGLVEFNQIKGETSGKKLNKISTNLAFHTNVNQFIICAIRLQCRLFEKIIAKYRLTLPTVKTISLPHHHHYVLFPCTTVMLCELVLPTQSISGWPTLINEVSKIRQMRVQPVDRFLLTQSTWRQCTNDWLGCNHFLPSPLLAECPEILKRS